MSKKFTDEEIKEILELVQHDKHTQYIGARYVPLFGRKNEPTIEWDNKAPYEPLTVVIHAGNSYTSRQYVPADIDITDESYWALTGNYNAQVEQYRRETAAVKAGLETETSERETADTALSGRITTLETTMPSKLDAVAHDDTLEGSGTSDEKLKVKLNHSAPSNDTGNTVYPALAKDKTTDEIKGIAFNAGDGLTAYNSDDIDVGSGIRLSDATKEILENGESHVYDIRNYHEPDDPDYTNAWNKIMDAIGTNHGTVLFPNQEYSGTFIITKRNIDVTGSGTLRSKITVANKNTSRINPSNINIHGLRFDTETECIEITNCFGLNITNNTFISDSVGIKGVSTGGTAMADQINIRHNVFENTPIGIKIGNPDATDLYYQLLDISDNFIDCTSNQIVVSYTDGVFVHNNTFQKGNIQLLIKEGHQLNISGNNFFEADSSAISLDNPLQTIINGNVITWCGQKEQAPAINIIGKNNMTEAIINGNTIEDCSQIAIYCDGHVFEPNIANNIITRSWCKTHYKGTEPHSVPTDALSIKTDNPYCTVLNNTVVSTYGVSDKTTNANNPQTTVDNVINNYQVNNKSLTNQQQLADHTSPGWNNKIPLFAIAKNTIMTTPEFLGDTVYSKYRFGFIYSFGGTLTLDGAVVVGANKSAVFMTTGSSVRISQLA